MLQSFSSMFWEVNCIDSPIYFIKKVGVFVVCKLLFISVLRTVFIPGIVVIGLGVVDLQIGHMIAC